MPNEKQKLFVVYNTKTGEVYFFNELRTKIAAKMAQEVMGDIKENWWVAQITYIEPIDVKNTKIEVVGTRHFKFDFLNKTSLIKQFLVDQKEYDKNESISSGGLYVPSCLANEIKDCDSPYYIIQYFEGSYVGKFGVYNKFSYNSHIEKDDYGEVLLFDTCEDANQYIKKKVIYQLSLGEVLEKRFVIYNKQSKQIATFSCDVSKFEKFKTLVDEGLSADEIAERLGMSKNRIVGKVNRFGWNLQNTNQSNTKTITTEILNTSICPGIFSSQKAAEHIAAELNRQTHQKDVWTVARLKQVELLDYNKPVLPIILGKADGRIFKQDLYEIKHLLIVGRIGTGKTTLLKSILISIEHQLKIANCKLVLIDTKKFDFNEYSSTYLMTPVITDAVKAVEYLNKIQSSDEDIAIVIDELADLIAVEPDTQNILINLAKNPKIHIIVATRKYDILINNFRNLFKNTICFNKIGCASYLSTSKKEIRFKTIFNTKEQ